MKKPEITPGPWNLGTLHGSPNGQIYGKKGEKIAKPLCFFMEDSEVQANATAIAALPDLLEALECCLPDWHAEDDLTQHDGLPAGEISLGDMRAIKAALTKAGYTFD